MKAPSKTRRNFLKSVALGAAGWTARNSAGGTLPQEETAFDQAFLIKRSELNLRFRHAEGARRLSFHNYQGPKEAWARDCRDKLAELMGVKRPPRAKVRELRRTQHQGVSIHALVMDVSDSLSIPAYLLAPPSRERTGKGVMAIHGHGEAAPLIGARDDYHHAFALELAKAGHVVICPEHRGFGTLVNLAHDLEGLRLDYWEWSRRSQFTLVTDSFLYSEPLIGQTVEDLLRWEDWFSAARNLSAVDVAGISYGGDLALTYPVYSGRVRKIFASGSLGSFSVIFPLCYNAPAHCIPGILQWMDRSDIAGLNAPRPITLHYGELDKPGPRNHSAAFNPSVEPSLVELRRIYRAFGAEQQIRLVVTPARGHEMDNDTLLSFLET